MFYLLFRDRLEIYILDIITNYLHLTSPETLTTYAYCPTPDCPQVYRLGPPETSVQCSECLAHVCACCKIEWHEGFSCTEIQQYQDPETRKNVGFMKSLGIKTCPKCGTLIAKTAGCNHITCTGCKTHICWVYMKDFGQSGGGIAYEHMSAVHGNWGL
jgi:hypothetical protein